jgi:hypothetical protein
MLLMRASFTPASAAFCSAGLSSSGLIGHVTMPLGFFAIIVCTACAWSDALKFELLKPAISMPSVLNSSSAPRVTAFAQSELVWNKSAAE